MRRKGKSPIGGGVCCGVGQCFCRGILMESVKSQRFFAGLIDRQIILAVLFAALIVAPRSFMIARAHSETYDVPYHLIRGLAYFTRTISKKDLSCNDPPLGEALIATPPCGIRFCFCLLSPPFLSGCANFMALALPGWLSRC